ncbi:ABC transporter ATP-binding protein [Micromonospora sp. NPDC126480]|uniref:ABC transporter ATP-binding protein/permease n=1 Tax=Micromonospora sp. NPDC126480 TaxID=3155312 RepID=UPI00332899C5
MLVRRRLLGLVAEAPGPVAGTVAAALAATGTAVITAVALAEALERAVAGQQVSRLAGPLTLAVAGVTARSVLLWLRDLAATKTAARVKLRLREKLTRRLLALGPGGTAGRPAGTVQTAVSDGVEALDAYVGFYLPQAVVSVVGPVFVVAILAGVDPVSALIVGVAVALLPVARPVFRRLLGRRGAAHWAAYEAFAARMLDALYGMTTLKTLGASDRHGERLRAEAARVHRASTRDLAASATVYVATALVTSAGTALVVAVAGLRHANGAVDAAAVLLVLLLAAEAFRPQLELQNYWHEGFSGVAAADGIFALLDAPAPVAEPCRARAARWGGGPVEVRFQKVSFTYPGTDQPAVVDVDLILPAGRTTALVGRSGAGKSTLAALLQRFHDPDRGVVEVNGVDLRHVPLRQARALTAVVGQDTYLFHASVADNLRIARPDATDADLAEACRRARVHDEITALPRGYDTTVGERGARLSGGQRQRLAIARALLADAPVVVLDEATSSVDGATEDHLRMALAEVTAGRTTLVIAHRLSTVADADQLVVLDGGRVVECGRPEDLLATDGPWSRLVAAHAGATR